MRWPRAVAVGIAVVFAVATAANWGAWPWFVVAGAAALVALGLRGAWLIETDPPLAFWLIVLGGIGVPLFLILTVPAALAWRRAARRRPGTPRAPAR